MADDDDNGSPRGLVGFALAKGGWFSGLCLSLWGFTGLVFDILPTSNEKLQAIDSDLSHVFLGLAIVGIAFKLKHSSDMMVKSEAEKRIQDPTLQTGSTVPAIQKEIQRQLAEPPAAPPAGSDPTVVADRKTPLVGITLPKP